MRIVLLSLFFDLKVFETALKLFWNVKPKSFSFQTVLLYLDAPMISSNGLTYNILKIVSIVGQDLSVDF